MTKQKIYSGFTLVETLIVVIIAGLLLMMTFNLGWDYINNLKFKQDRDTYINVMDETIVIARTTNYYKDSDQKYSYLDMHIQSDSIDISYGDGNIYTDPAGSAAGGNVFSVTFKENSLRFIDTSSDKTIRLEPFALGCNIGGAGIQTDSFTFAIESNAYDYETCYNFDTTVCKFRQIVCNTTQ